VLQERRSVLICALQARASKDVVKLLLDRGAKASINAKSMVIFRI
jgi:hypothetical protein